MVQQIEWLPKGNALSRAVAQVKGGLLLTAGEAVFQKLRTLLPKARQWVDAAQYDDDAET